MKHSERYFRLSRKHKATANSFVSRYRKDLEIELDCDNELYHGIQDCIFSISEHCVILENMDVIIFVWDETVISSYGKKINFNRDYKHSRIYIFSDYAYILVPARMTWFSFIGCLQCGWNITLLNNTGTYLCRDHTKKCRGNYAALDWKCVYYYFRKLKN